VALLTGVSSIKPGDKPGSRRSANGSIATVTTRRDSDFVSADYPDGFGCAASSGVRSGAATAMLLETAVATMSNAFSSLLHNGQCSVFVFIVTGAGCLEVR
jgi:hypothetical protein